MKSINALLIYTGFLLDMIIDAIQRTCLEEGQLHYIVSTRWHSSIFTALGA